MKTQLKAHQNDIDKGYLKIRALSSENDIPIQNARIEISDSGNPDSDRSDAGHSDSNQQHGNRHSDSNGGFPMIIVFPHFFRALLLLFHYCDEY